MRLILHIVWKDARRLVWPLAGWMALLASKTLLGFHFVKEAGPEAWRDLSQIAEMLGWADVAMTFVLAALVVLEDSTLNERAFWLTRPIAGGRMLAAKVLALFLLLGVPPVVIAWPWWLTNGFSANQLCLATLQTLAQQGIVGVLALLATVFCNSLTRVVIWTLLGLAGVAVAILGLNPNGSLSRGMVIILFLITVLGPFTLGLAAGRYRRQGWVASLIPALGLTLAVCGMAAGVKSYRLHAEAAQNAEPESGPTKGVTMSLSPLAIPEGHQVEDKTVDVHLETLLRFGGLPSGTLVEGPAVDYVWSWKDGRAAQKPEATFIRARFGDMVALCKMFGVTPKYWDGKPLPIDGPQLMQGSMRVWHSTSDRLRQEPVTVTAKADLVLIRLKLLMELPLRPGAWQAARGVGRRVASEVRAGDTIVDCVETLPYSPLLELGRRGTGWFDSPDTDEFAWVVDVVVERGKYEGLGEHYRSRTANVWLAGVRIAGMEVSAAGVTEFRNGRWVPKDPDWLEHTTLAVVGWHAEGQFHRETTTEGFHVVDASQAPDRDREW